MAIMRISPDQMKRCYHKANYGGEGFDWYDATNDTNAKLSKYDEPDPAIYDREDFVQFRIPAAALTGFNINTVRLFLHVISVNRPIPIHVYVKDYDEYENGSGSIAADSIAGAGWSDTPVTALFNALSNKNAIWYAQVRVGSVSQDTDYTAYINTLNGDNDPYIEIDYAPEPCVAPNLDALAAIAETNPTLSGSGASGDQYGNEITGYEIQYAESADGETWGDWAAETMVSTPESSFSTSVVISPTRGNSMKWRVRTLGEAGEAYYSDWVESGAVRRNSVPSAPASISVNPSIYEDNGITITWPAALDIDDNVAAYELQRAVSTDGSTWSDWATVDANISTLYSVDSPAVARGEYVKYRIRAKDAFGIISDYVESRAVRRNQVPPAVTIDYPKAGKTTYNARPRLLITLGAEPDGQLQTLTATGYTASSAGPYESGQKLILRKTSAADAGSISATITPKDSQEVEGASASVDTTYTVPSWTDNITAGATRIKAVHINELRSAVDVVRAYYGLSAYDWPEPITAGQTSMRGWAGHIAELRSAIDEVVALVNSWDNAAVSNKITQPTWAALGVWPEAAVLSQIRTAITQL